MKRNGEGRLSRKLVKREVEKTRRIIAAIEPAEFVRLRQETAEALKGKPRLREFAAQAIDLAMMEAPLTLSGSLIEMRELLGLSQRALADRVGTSKSTIIRCEDQRGRLPRNPEARARLLQLAEENGFKIGGPSQ
jgi:DNA-binding transcriptional regulator YiaG